MRTSPPVRRPVHNFPQMRPEPLPVRDIAPAATESCEARDRCHQRPCVVMPAWP
jgi:hypothetical protein